MATQFANGKIVTDGLVLCLDAADLNSYPTTGTTWFDLAGSNNGTLTNGPTFNGTGASSSIAFDGTNDYMFFNNTSVFNFGTSDISYRFIIGSIALTWNSLYTKRNPPTQPDDDIRTYVNSSLKVIRLYIGSSAPMDISTPTISNTGVFDINIVLVRSLYWQVYINGSLVGTNNSSAFTNKALTNISGDGIPQFGRQLTGEYANLNCHLFQIYNRALTASEVLQNYNAQKGRFGIS